MKSIRRRFTRGQPTDAPVTIAPVGAETGSVAVDLAPDDPLLAHLQSAREAVDIGSLELDSPALRELKAAGVTLAVPLVSHGELIGVLNLGPRRSDQEYSSDDRRLLWNLAAQAAPALRVGQLVREQELEAVTRQRYEQELEVARLIQQNYLPRQLPDVPGWEITAHYQPAREVGGDFYDVIALPGGRVGLVIGDVTDKGVPAALVMAATRSVLRATAQRLVDPGVVLRNVNDHLCPDMPPKMFVTCLYAVLDPASGRLRLANAGHDLPKLRAGEVRARGMPLGLMTGMDYEEVEVTLGMGEGLLLHSDGIVEAHDPAREMFGVPRLTEAVGAGPGGRALIDRVLAQLAAFTGPDAEQEDDITMVAVERAAPALAEFELASAPGNEREAIARVEQAVAGVDLSAAVLERLKTAVGEAAMNAMEHGNRYAPDKPVTVRVLRDGERLRVQVADYGEAAEAPDAETPDIEAKLEGRQTPRGWGLFLIEQMVDEARVFNANGRRTLELVLNLDHGGARHD